MRELILLFARILKQLMVQNKTLKRMEDKMAQDIAALNAAIAELQAKASEDVTQVALLITKVNELIEIIKSTPGTPDFTDQIAAIQAAVGTITGDNAAIQAALDAAPVTPPNP